MVSKPLRVGIIGLGHAGTMHREAWQSVGRANVVAAADPAPDTRSHALAAGLAAYSDAFEMLAREHLHAVSICTPPSTHPSLTIASLERGLHVLCEKPLAIDGRSALRMLRAAAAAGRSLLLATKFRHVPDLIRARALLREGAIGDPLFFELEFSSAVPMVSRWNARPEISGGGVLIDNGCHAFDIVSFLFGPIARVHVTRLKQVQQMNVEDSAAVLVTTADGTVGQIVLSWSLPSRGGPYLRLRGTAGTIDVGWDESFVHLNGQPAERIGGGYDKAGAHRAMMQAFCRIVDDDHPPWISPGDCLRTVVTVEAAHRSLGTEAWEELTAQRHQIAWAQNG